MISKQLGRDGESLVGETLCKLGEEEIDNERFKRYLMMRDDRIP
jgi:hypothetical protein